MADTQGLSAYACKECVDRLDAMNEFKTLITSAQKVITITKRTVTIQKPSKGSTDEDAVDPILDAPVIKSERSDSIPDDPAIKIEPSDSEELDEVSRDPEDLNEYPFPKDDCEQSDDIHPQTRDTSMNGRLFICSLCGKGKPTYY